MVVWVWSAPLCSQSWLWFLLGFVQCARLQGVVVVLRVCRYGLGGGRVGASGMPSLSGGAPAGHALSGALERALDFSRTREAGSMRRYGYGSVVVV